MKQIILCALTCLLALGTETASSQLMAQGPLSGAVIVVDPGHGGQRYSKSYTGGTKGVDSNTTESELNLRVSFELARLLREDGATVFLTREANHRLSPEGTSARDELHARIDFFEHHNCHFFLSIHHNAGKPQVTGHTCLYKKDVEDDTLYHAIARDVNDAMEGVIQGPKLGLIKGNYHLTRETSIPGTITEGGFMTNKVFDEMQLKADFPLIEAEAIRNGARKYWSENKDALIALREKLAAERAARPEDPNRITAIALRPEFLKKMSDLVAKVAPEGTFEPSKIADYLAKFKEVVVTDPEAQFEIQGTFDGQNIRLTGTTSKTEYHNTLIDLLVAMKLYNIVNEVELPGKTPAAPAPAPVASTPAAPMPTPAPAPEAAPVVAAPVVAAPAKPAPGNEAAAKPEAEPAKEVPAAAKAPEKPAASAEPQPAQPVVKPAPHPVYQYYRRRVPRRLR